MELSIEKVINLIIEKKKVEYKGRRYYYYKPEKLPVYQEYYDRGDIKTRQAENSQEVYTNWFKVLVNQKIDYSLSKPVTVKPDIPMEFNIEDIVDKTALNASMDSIGWVQIYINKQNKLDWICRNDSQIIPIYDEYKKYIEKIIYFWIDEESKDKQESEKITHVQVWDNTQVTEFNIKDGKLHGTISTKNHYLEVIKYRDIEEEINPKSFGFVPFIPMFNNKNHETDLEGIDILLDCYNEISTGFINNVRKFQEMVMKLVGYGGQDLDEFMKQLKKYKVIPVDENGDFDYVKVDIPVEARKVLMEIIQKNIFILGRGVDPSDDFGGSNITNVLIKSKYANLDMKCSDMEKQIRLFYKQLITIVNYYYQILIENEIKFTRTQIFNETEQIDNCLKSMNMTSNETVLENHPWVVDVKTELGRISKENKEEIDKLNENPFQDNKSTTVQKEQDKEI
jgi:SPP1 family phage portal protein